MKTPATSSTHKHCLLNEKNKKKPKLLEKGQLDCGVLVGFFRRR
jgi:hypothetical protein